MLCSALTAHVQLQSGVFTRAQAMAAGYDEDAIRSQVRRRHWVVLRRGVYVEREVFDATAGDVRARHLLHTWAALLRLDGPVVASHDSGALNLGLRLLEWPTDVHSTRAAAVLRSPDRYDGLYVHRATLPPHHLHEIEGMPSVAAARAVADIARLHGVRAGVVTADSALQLERCTPDDLREVAADMEGWPNVSEVVRTVELADKRGQSVGESVSRLGFLESPLPQPEPQFKVYDADGRLIAVTDFGWRELGVVGEVDGKVKYAEDATAAVWGERYRQQDVEDTGLVVVRWTHAESLFRFGDVVIPRVERGFRRAQAMGLARSTPRTTPA